jgi:hypothetical protein
MFGESETRLQQNVGHLKRCEIVMDYAELKESGWTFVDGIASRDA